MDLQPRISFTDADVVADPRLWELRSAYEASPDHECFRGPDGEDVYLACAWVERAKARVLRRLALEDLNLGERY